MSAAFGPYESFVYVFERLDLGLQLGPLLYEHEKRLVEDFILEQDRWQLPPRDFHVNPDSSGAPTLMNPSPRSWIEIRNCTWLCGNAMQGTIWRRNPTRLTSEWDSDCGKNSVLLP